MTGEPSYGIPESQTRLSDWIITKSEQEKLIFTHQNAGQVPPNKKPVQVTEPTSPTGVIDQKQE